MLLRCKRAFLLCFAVCLLIGSAWSGIRAASAQDVSPWLISESPLLRKIVDLPNNVPPDGNNADCMSYTYVPKFGLDTRTACLFDSPLGTLTSGGQIQTGPNSFVDMQGVAQSSYFIPSPDPNLALLSVRSPGIGNYIGIYHHLTKATLHSHDTITGSFYDITEEPDEMLVDPATHLPLQVAINSIAYSANGQWMVVNVPGAGLLRVNMTDFSTLLFSAPLEPTWYLGLANPPLAITNDGRYVAANTDLFEGGRLTVYDLSTCVDQLNIAPVDANYCNGKDIWNGRTLKGAPIGTGIKEQWAGISGPAHLRFVNNDAITFNARYGVDTITGRYKAAVFTVTAPGGVEHKLGLLGMGDSYISGQGAFAYRQVTDTDENTCHLSELSYPFILGSEYFNSSNSVACSGAVTEDVSGHNLKYKGQMRVMTATDAQAKAPILANFLPGYIYQQEFASAYRPEAMLLSVGGDDIHFAEIVKACVANAGGGTCYDTYEDRAELAVEINSIYPKLVNTYKTLRQQSAGARLYVVGYPQVAKPDGDCGLNVHLNRDEVAFSAHIVTYLNGVIRQAAQTAGVFYVDTEHAFDGHRLCESGTQAMNGLTAGDDAGVKIKGRTINVLGNESYHPTQLGYKLLADTIADQTSGLSAEMPAATAYAAPAFNPNDPLLQGVPETGRPLRITTKKDDIAEPFMFRGDLQQVTVDGQGIQLQPHSQYQIVLHSDPIVLDEGAVDAGGNIAAAVHIPQNVEPGYHVLHVYGTNMAGQSVDIQKFVYVAASADDFDGDGVPNSANACLVIPKTGQDADHDDIDDACDTTIVPTDDTSTTITATTTTISDKGVTDTSRPILFGTVDPATGQVLGQATSELGVPSTKGSAKDATADVTLSPSAQKLFYLNWVTVLEVGVGWTIGGTLLYHGLRRQ